MKPIVIALTAVIALVQIARADFAAQLSEATRPLNEGVPEIAVVRLQALLKDNLSETDWRAAAEKLAEALVGANQAADAFKLLNDPRLGQSSTANFWRAQLLASLHREAEALAAYQRVASDQSSTLHDDALFGAGEMLRALGRRDEALQVFAPLFRVPKWSVGAQLRAAELYLDKSDAANARRLLEKVQPVTTAEKHERHFLRGRLELVLHRPDRAISIFGSVLKQSDGASHDTLTAALFSLADAHLQLSTPEAGDDALENFIEHHPADVDLARVFAKLDELYRAEKKPSRTELDRWARDLAQPRRAFAQWYLARFDLRVGRRDRAIDLFAALRRTHPQLSELAPAFLEFAKLQLEEHHFDDAIAILTEARVLRPNAAVRDRIDLLAGEIDYDTKHFDAAVAQYEKIAHSDSPLASIGIYNAALSWLQKGDETRFLATADEFVTKAKDENSGANLRLDAALAEAGKGEARAADSLRSFLREFPNARRSAEAWVALAELAFHATPPRIDEARKDLSRAAELKPSDAAQERADYLMIWLEDATASGDAKVIELAKKFIQQHEASSLIASVRMKLGEMYFRAQDFANAETQFELLAEQNPNGPFTERALFFAGEAAMASMAAQSLDRALVLFDRVVQFNGELKFFARNEQAVIERKLNKAPDALALYEEVLNAAPARPGEKREALCGKGDIYLEMAAADSQNYQRAIDAYDKLAADREAPAHWRNQALFKKGLCLEKRGDRTGALATFYGILDEPAQTEKTREFFWFYKAGFNAGQLLEADEKWESAAAIYEKLAAAGGTRANEAREKVDRLRLEHFLRQQ